MITAPHVAMSFHLQVGIQCNGANQIDKVRDHLIRQLVGRRTFAYGGDIEYSRELPISKLC